jgi:hypothetical protein
MIKAELIQASNNLATHVPIFTFKFTYPKKNWLLDVLGLSKYDLFAKYLVTSYYITDTDRSDLMTRPSLEANASVYRTLGNQVGEIMEFAQHIFNILYVPTDGTPSRMLSVADVNKAMQLFGPRLQDVLKQHKPGEMHLPMFPLNTGHSALALSSEGIQGTWYSWQQCYPPVA